MALLNFFHQGQRVAAGTGFLCQPDVILTARHNLSAMYDAVGVWLAYDARRNPNGSAMTIRSFATHARLDLAVFVLTSPGPTTFQLGGPAASVQAQVTVAGFAMPYSDDSVRYSYAAGPVTARDANQLSYAISTRPGDSGAPVFTVAGGSPVAVGIHTEGASSARLGNSGIPLTPAIIQDIHQMIAYARSQ